MVREMLVKGPRDVGKSPRDVGKSPRDVGKSPRDVGKGPRDVGQKRSERSVATNEACLTVCLILI